MTSTSVLESDAYKCSMAVAGMPLCMETFYFSFRRGGPIYISIDLEKYVESILPPTSIQEDELQFLDKHHYTFMPAMMSALMAQSTSLFRVRCAPKGSWVFPGEPIVTITAPSFLVSWLESKLTAIQYVLQLGTKLVGGYGPISYNKFGAGGEQVAISDDHEEIIRSTFDAVDVALVNNNVHRIDAEYEDTLNVTFKKILEAVGGNGNRIIEGGMRAAICMGHHKKVLEAMKEVGIKRTSNMFLAKMLDLIPVGTAGHEHTQRYGEDYLAMSMFVDRVPGISSCLPDTWSTMQSGLPATFRVAEEHPHRNFLCRFDSGHREGYFVMATKQIQQRAIENIVFNIAGDMDSYKITAFEKWREITNWPATRLSYMIGGAVTGETLPTSLTRSRVAAVFKLSMSNGKACMKFGDDQMINGNRLAVANGKMSVPGDPIVFRKTYGEGPIGIVGQAGEDPPDRNYMQLDHIGDDIFMRGTHIRKDWHPDNNDICFSEATHELIATFIKGKEECL